MIKPFNELTKKEFKKLVKQKITFGQLEKDYPQPKWCQYPNAVYGVMGCWSLMAFMVKDEEYCKKCSCYAKVKTPPTAKKENNAK